MTDTDRLRVFGHDVRIFTKRSLPTVTEPEAVRILATCHAMLDLVAETLTEFHVPNETK